LGIALGVIGFFQELSANSSEPSLRRELGAFFTKSPAMKDISGGSHHS
jgi:hypothetical protein